MSTFYNESIINSSKHNTNILYALIIACYIFLGWVVYSQYQYNQLLEQRVAELEKTVVVKDAVVSTITEQLGEELADLYRLMIVKLSGETDQIQ